MIALLITLPAKQNSNNANFNYDITSPVMTIESCLQLRSQQGVALALSSDDCYWRQKSSSLNVVQYNTTSRPIIIHLQIYIA